MEGVWERMIRTVKRVLSGIIEKSSRFTDAILSTLMCEVENIANSRPLTKVSDDIDDMRVLTPNHILILKDGPRIPPGAFDRGNMYRRRWRYVQYLSNLFWRRWISLYLPELQKRQKWLKSSSNMKVGEVVLIMNEKNTRSMWPLGVISDVVNGRDGFVRSVKIRTKSGELVRPITKENRLEC